MEPAIDKEVMHRLGGILTNGQNPQFGHPLFSSPSAVHSLFLMLSHAKSFTLRGAQAFQRVEYTFDSEESDCYAAVSNLNKKKKVLPSRPFEKLLPEASHGYFRRAAWMPMCKNALKSWSPSWAVHATVSYRSRTFSKLSRLFPHCVRGEISVYP